MQQDRKFTQEKLDYFLKILSEFAFDIDDESRIILGLIAKNGSSTETKITSLGKRRILLSREKIRRRLLVTDLSDGFTSTKKGRKIGNLKGKQEKFFSLTFKGILASLYETKLSENFWIKNYVTNIEKITNKTIADLLLQNIYHCIILHFLLNIKTKGSLTHYNSSQTDVSDNYNSSGYLHYLVYSKNDIQGISLKFQKLFINSSIEFYVSCSTISNLLHDVELSPKFLTDRKGSESDRFQIIFFEDWMYTIFDVVGKSFEKIFKKYPDHDYPKNSFNMEEILGDSPSVTIEEISKKQYLQLKPKGKFERAHTLLSPKPIPSDRFVEDSIDDTDLFE